MYAKLRAGGGGYDVIFPSTFFIKMLVDNKMVQPLKHDLLPNVGKNFDARFRDKIYDGSLTYTVPYTVFYTGLAFRKDKSPGLTPSWNLYMDPQFKGRSTLIGDMHMTIGAALKTLGFSLNSTNVVELEQARDLVIKWKANIARFENEAYKTGLASSEFLLCMAYSGDIVQVQEEAPQVTFIYPKEGYPCSCDEMVISSTSRNVELAHRFINFIYDPEWAAKNICYTGFCSPVAPAYSKIPPNIATTPRYSRRTKIWAAPKSCATSAMPHPFTPASGTKSRPTNSAASQGACRMKPLAPSGFVSLLWNPLLVSAPPFCHNPTHLLSALPKEHPDDHVFQTR